jgi:nicotinate-nucleotide pyrophosphorylase (carboxylating)
MLNFEQQLKELVAMAIKEDIGDGDHSSLSCIPADARGKAVLKIKEDGVIAGVSVAEKIFSWYDSSSVFTPLKKDGDVMTAGEDAFTVEGLSQTILKLERLVLNILQRMSGITTLTRQYVNALEGCATKVLDTRKTTPNFRLLEKEAVRIGGGHNHRMGLYDMIMLKDNHIDYAGSLEKAIEKAWLYAQNVKPGLKIEVETRTLDDVKRVVATGKVNRVMFDNFSIGQIVEAMKITAGKVETEASGGINLKNIREYAETGVDYVSVGALIHQARSVDLSLKAER